jgi:YNFM family putative membrane transporter
MMFYYVGSSVAGTSGGLFWAAFEWPGVIGSFWSC